MDPPLFMRLGAAIFGLTVAVSYSLVRRGILTWGATEVPEPEYPPRGTNCSRKPTGFQREQSLSTRLSAAVWPWLAQMGPSPRGGAYTYDWIENLLGLDMHSVDRVLPEFQRPEVDNMVGFGSNRMRLARAELNRVLSWHSEDNNWVWSFLLDEHDGGTRLISRNRFRLPTLVLASACCRWAGFSCDGAEMLLGIKARAERLASGGSNGALNRRRSTLMSRFL